MRFIRVLLVSAVFVGAIAAGTAAQAFMKMGKTTLETSVKPLHGTLYVNPNVLAVPMCEVGEFVVYTGQKTTTPVSTFWYRKVMGLPTVKSGLACATL